jgi:hypothetical protein
VRAPLLALLLLPALLGAAPARSPGALAIENAVLAKRLELAKGEQFYLLLSPERRTLTLMLKGATLFTYEVKELTVGRPRIAFFTRGGGEDWQGEIWSGGTLIPARQRERLEVIATPGMSTEEAEARTPPTPEEIYEVPPRRFLVRFQEGVSLDVRPVGVAASGLKNWLADLFSAVKPRPDDVLRLRVVLEKEHFDAMYRALPPDVKLMALPPAAVP